MNKKYKLIKNSISSVLCLTTLLSLSGCVKEVDCDIDGEHVHVYVNSESHLTRYIDSEKEYIDDLSRTDSYLNMNDELKFINDNKLYIVEENINYLNNEIKKYSLTRQAYVYDYIYGSYYGYDYGFNPASGEYEYYYGFHTGHHYGYEWQDIGLDEYTTDKVRDITYKFRFYKKNDEGKLTSQLFSNLEEVPNEYKYFMQNDLIEKFVSDEYYLTSTKTK